MAAQSYVSSMQPNELTGAIIGAAIEVHRELGPGKSEVAYETALAHELSLRGIPHQQQRPVPVVYKGVKLDCGYRLDLLVNQIVVLEVKSVEATHPVHRAQVLTYLKLGGWKVALLLNFNVALLKEGIERFVLDLEEHGRQTAKVSPTQSIRATPSDTVYRLHSIAESTDAEAERLAREIIASAVEVHRCLGPGLLPSAYRACLCRELSLRGMPFERSRTLPLNYKGIALAQSAEVELVVGNRLVVNPCAVNEAQAVHEASLLSQLRLGGWKLGLLINFNRIAIAEGLRRVVLS